MMKVLIVEDDPINMKLIIEILDSLDFMIQTATNGFEALAMADKDLYNLILMDIELPGLDGIETAQRIKNKPGYNKTPIIAVTAFAMKGDREKILDAGLDYYVSKPIHVADFIKLISDIFKRRNNESESKR
ncbi:MAG: response regulator [Candidatus Methanoperedens sp.]|nr:response regulator [Candidatus Methanoperedens sp.]